jgi:hypothetical protein
VPFANQQHRGVHLVAKKNTLTSDFSPIMYLIFEIEVLFLPL